MLLVICAAEYSTARDIKFEIFVYHTSLLSVLAEIRDVLLAGSLIVLHFPGCLACEVSNAVRKNSL